MKYLVGNIYPMKIISRRKILLMSQKIKKIFNEAKLYKEQCVSSNALYHI